MSVYWSCRCYWPVDLFFPLRFAYTQNQLRCTAEMASLHCCLIQKSRYKSPFVPFRFYCNRSSSLFGSWCLVKERSNDTHTQHPKKILYVCFFLQNHRLPICLTFQQQLPPSFFHHRTSYVVRTHFFPCHELWMVKHKSIFDFCSNCPLKWKISSEFIANGISKCHISQMGSATNIR